MNIVLFVKKIWNKSNKDLLFTHSTSLAYYSFIYFVPILALFYFFFDYFHGFEKVKESIHGVMGAYLAPQVADTILKYVELIQKNVSAETIGIFGLIGFLISSCLMLYRIEFSFNHMLGKHRPTERIRRMIKYIFLMTTGPVFVGLSVMAQQAVYKLSDGHIIFNFVSILVSVLPLITTMLFMTILYKWVSAIPLSWKTCLKAGAFAGIAIEIVKQLYAYYVVFSFQGSAYGTMAVLPLFLIWINLTWTIVLFGAEICCYLNDKEDQSTLS